MLAGEELVTSRVWHLEDSERFETFRRVSEATRFRPGVGLPGRVLSSGKPAWITDVTKDRNFPRAQMATELGVKGAFGFPVLVGKDVVAVLEFFSDRAVEPHEALLDVQPRLARSSDGWSNANGQKGSCAKPRTKPRPRPRRRASFSPA